VWRHFKSLRFKLASLYVVVFGAILTVLGIIILTVSERDLRNEFDFALRDRAEAMADRIVVSPDEWPPSPSPANPIPRLNPFRFPRHYIQIRLADESVAERSPNLGKQILPLSDQARQARTTNQPVFETLRDEIARALIGSDSGELRLLTIYRQAAHTAPFYLQVGVNQGRVNQSVQDLRRLFLLLMPTGLAVVAVASWWLAGRFLGPIRRIAELAGRLGAHNLGLRFDPPQGQDEIAELVVTINQMLDRISEAFQAQERFMADVSHELKTPLSVLLGEAQVMLQKERSTADYERFVRSVQDEVRSLAQTVDSVLTLTHAEAGAPITNAAELALNDVVMEAVERCQPLALQRGVRIVPVLALPRGDRSGPVLLGDPELLCILFVNLIRNAVRYSPVGMAVDVHVRWTDTEAEVSVRDHGPGIPPQYIDRVFERFFRVPQNEGQFKGAGLGLTIARGIARLHAGSVQVANCPDGGCLFTVLLSLRHLSPQPNPQ